MSPQSDASVANMAQVYDYWLGGYFRYAQTSRAGSVSPAIRACRDNPPPPDTRARYGPSMDPKTEELRAAHDVLAEFYAARLATALDHMPEEQAVLGLFCERTRAAGADTSVADIGCGPGWLEPFLAARGLSPRGVDLSPEMIRVARRDHPDFDFEVSDLRDLPYPDASLAGVVCWYSLMYLAPSDRPAAFGEFARVVAPGGYLVTAFKAGDGQLRRGGAAIAAAAASTSSSTSTGCHLRRWSDG